MVGHVWDASLAALRPTLMRSKLLAAKPLAPEIVHRKPAVAGSPRATTWAYNFDSGSVPRVSFEMRSMPCRELRGELACSNRLPRCMPSGPVSYSSTAPRSAWEQALCMAGVARRYLDAYEPLGKVDGRLHRPPAAAQSHRDAAGRSERSAPRRSRTRACCSRTRPLRGWCALACGRTVMPPAALLSCARRHARFRAARRMRPPLACTLGARVPSRVC